MSEFQNTVNFPQGTPESNQEKARQQEEQRQNLLEARRMTLRALLTVEAQERLNRISSVKPQKAILIEDYLLRSLSSSGGGRKIDDVELKRIIELFTNAQPVKQNIKIQRKRWDDDDDDDDDLDNL